MPVILPTEIRAQFWVLRRLKRPSGLSDPLPRLNTKDTVGFEKLKEDCTVDEVRVSFSRTATVSGLNDRRWPGWKGRGFHHSDDRALSARSRAANRSSDRNAPRKKKKETCGRSQSSFQFRPGSGLLQECRWLLSDVRPVIQPVESVWCPDDNLVRVQT